MTHLLAVLALFALCLCPAAAQEAAVQVRDGIPTMLIDGQPVAPVIYRENYTYNFREQSQAHYQGLYRAGVRIFFFPIGIGHSQTHDQRVDSWSKYSDPVIEDLIAATGPDIRILLMIPTELRRNSNKQWAEQNPDEMMVWPPAMSPGDRASVSSLKARQLARTGLTDLIEYVEARPYADNIIGYFLCGGGGEWLDYWDYSPAAEAGFRRWLSAKYADDAALQKAWASPQVTLHTAALPEWQSLQKGDVGIFLDPAESRQTIDFYQFFHEDLAEAASDICRAAKEACGGRRLVGIWGGYYFFPNWSPADRGVFRRRQGAFEITVKDPNIDFFMGPYSYRERHPGGVFAPQFLNSTMRLHGKLAVVEEDSRTSLAALVDDAYSPETSPHAYCTLGDSFGRSTTIAESVEVLKRNFAGIFSQPGMGVQWYCLGNHGGWYEDPALLDAVTKLSRLAHTQFSSVRRASEIAVIVSNRSLWYQRLNDFTPDLNTRLLVEGLGRLGAPADIYLETDLEHPDFPFDRYKLFVFANCFHLSAAQRQIIKQRVQTAGKTVLSLYATGYADDDRLSLEGVQQITGMTMASAPVSLVKGAEVVITDYSHAATHTVPEGTRYGTAREFGPILWCDDPEATVLGELISTDVSGNVFTLRKPGGLCVRQHEGWTSVWSAVPNLPPDLMRSIAAMAGVHIYSDGNDAVYASDRLLGVHTAYSGPRTIHLPRTCRVTDVLSGEVLADGVREFTVELPARSTGLWELQ